jgi:hypothetical protein
MQEAYCRSVCKSLLHTYSAHARADVQSYTHAHAQTRQSSDALAQDVLHSQSHACQPARAHTCQSIMPHWSVATGNLK